jgi:hypothetical protein
VAGCAGRYGQCGATWLDQEVVRDGNLVTSRGPQDHKTFLQAITDVFSQLKPSQEASAVQVASSPQRNTPPEVVNLQAVRRLRFSHGSRPSTQSLCFRETYERRGCETE